MVRMSLEPVDNRKKWLGKFSTGVAMFGKEQGKQCQERPVPSNPRVRKTDGTLRTTYLEITLDRLCLHSPRVAKAKCKEYTIRTRAENIQPHWHHMWRWRRAGREDLTGHQRDLDEKWYDDLHPGKPGAWYVMSTRWRMSWNPLPQSTPRKSLKKHGKIVYPWINRSTTSLKEGKALIPKCLGLELGHQEHRFCHDKYQLSKRGGAQQSGQVEDKSQKGW